MKNAYREWMAKRIKYWRLKMGWKQREAAENMGVIQRTFAAHEEKRSIPNAFRIKRFCEACGISIDEFMKGSP